MIAMITPAVILRPDGIIRTNPFPTALSIAMLRQRRKPRLVINRAVILIQFKRKTVKIDKSRLLIAVKMHTSNRIPSNPLAVYSFPFVNRTAVTVPPIPRDSVIPIEIIVRESLFKTARIPIVTNVFTSKHIARTPPPIPNEQPLKTMPNDLVLLARLAFELDIHPNVAISRPALAASLMKANVENRWITSGLNFVS